MIGCVNQHVKPRRCPRFLLDNSMLFYYSGTMLDGIKIFSSDSVWRQILSDFGATVPDSPDGADVNFDLLNIHLPASALDIKAAIQDVLDGDRLIIRNIFGHDIHLPAIQARIVIMLYKSGGMSGNDLRVALGYAPDATTHVVDTAIYQLRRTFGREFIQNNGGIYKIGKL